MRNIRIIGRGFKRIVRGRMLCFIYNEILISKFSGSLLILFYPIISNTFNGLTLFTCNLWLVFKGQHWGLICIMKWFSSLSASWYLYKSSQNLCCLLLSWICFMILTCKLWTLLTKDTVELDIWEWGDKEKRFIDFLDSLLWTPYD